MTQKTWRVGVAGLGTVGGGLLQFLAEQPDFAPAGDRAVVTAVSARSKSRPRTVDISGLTWFDDPVALASSPDVDLFVELVGGSDGPAKAAVEAALKLGKPVVTANKALIAEHGAELAALAEANDAPAAVRGRRDGRHAGREDAARGHGRRRGDRRGRHPQRHLQLHPQRDGEDRPRFRRRAARGPGLGYAEADPTMDVGGFDAGHKISILAALAFGCAPDFERRRDRGHQRGRAAGHQAGQGPGLSHQAGGRRRQDDDGVSVKVHPSLVPLEHPLAQAGGALNALFIEGKRIGRIFIQGPGAGAGPTAAAVAADIADVMTGPCVRCSRPRPAS
jgi:homoserine dehydrogenase